MSASIYVSPTARDAVLADYDARLEVLKRVRRVEVRDVPTHVGPTRVLVLGPEDGAPLVVVHGANGDAMQMAVPLGALADRYRCAFVDVPGEPNRSTETRPDLGGPGVGAWMGEVLDGLGFARAAMWGMSGGAYVVLRAGTTIAARIRRAVLVVPAGIVPMGTFPAPRPENTDALLEAITAPGSGLPRAAVAQMARQLRGVLAAVRSPFSLVGPLFTGEELGRFDVPTLVAGGGHDVIFPGEPLLERAGAHLPRLEEEVLLPHANHVHLDWVLDGPFLELAREFLARDDEGDRDQMASQ